MIKLDPNSLEKLSFAFNEQDIARFMTLCDLLKKENLSSLSAFELENFMRGLYNIGELKLNGKYYAFHVSDTYAANQGDDAGEGVEIWLRQGNQLRDFLSYPSRDGTLKADYVASQLMQKGIRQVYTGPFIKGSKFLNLPQECDQEDPIYRLKLEENEIVEFRSLGIEVEILGYLI